MKPHQAAWICTSYIAGTDRSSSIVVPGHYLGKGDMTPLLLLLVAVQSPPNLLWVQRRSACLLFHCTSIQLAWVPGACFCVWKCACCANCMISEQNIFYVVITSVEKSMECINLFLLPLGTGEKYIFKCFRATLFLYEGTGLVCQKQMHLIPPINMYGLLYKNTQTR